MLIGNALTCDRGGNFIESAKVIILAIVETEALLIDVTEKMKRFDANIGSANSALEQAPKVFDAVGMHVAANIRFHVIDDIVCIFFFKANVGRKLIGKKLAFRLNRFSDFSLDCFGRDVLNYLSSDLADSIAAMPFEYSHDDSLTGGATAFDAFVLCKFVHIASLAADIGFIGFNLTGELFECSGLHGEPDAVQQEPCGLLS